VDYISHLVFHLVFWRISSTFQPHSQHGIRASRSFSALSAGLRHVDELSTTDGLSLTQRWTWTYFIKRNPTQRITFTTQHPTQPTTEASSPDPTQPDPTHVNIWTDMQPTSQIHPRATPIRHLHPLYSLHSPRLREIASAVISYAV